MLVSDLVDSLFDGDPPVRVEAYDGSATGPLTSEITVVVRSPDAFRRLLTAPGELGLARAYVAGDIDVDGDIRELVARKDLLTRLHVGPRQLAVGCRFLGGQGIGRPPAPPPEEIRLRGRRHSAARDRRAISHHYDVSNEFYELLLGPTMTYSCGVWDRPDVGLDAAQEAKYELICRKLDLRPGMRLLDVGCGWGGMVAHAARHHGVVAVGITVSGEQADLARRRVAAAGLADRVEIRLQDYRAVADAPFDAISSIGMFEHVGLSQLGTYFMGLRARLRQGGRLLNHGISRPWHPWWRHPRIAARSFMDRYVFPDAELHEIGRVTTAMHHAGMEIRHMESLREHYGLTLRAWLTNLEQHWAEAVRLAGEGRCRVWRLYLAGAAANFDDGRLNVYQSMAVRTTADGASTLPLRLRFEAEPMVDLTRDAGADQIARSRPSQ